MTFLPSQHVYDDHSGGRGKPRAGAGTCRDRHRPAGNGAGRKTVATRPGVIAIASGQLIPIAHGPLAVEQLRVRLQSGLRQRLTTLSLPAGQVGRSKFKRDLIGARSLCLHEHISCQGSDAFEGHMKRLSKAVGFNTDRHMRGQTQNVGTSVQGSQNERVCSNHAA